MHCGYDQQVMASWKFAAVLVLAACSPIPRGQGDGGVPSDAAPAQGCTKDEECGQLGLYGYCRIFPEQGERYGVCVID